MDFYFGLLWLTYAKHIKKGFKTILTLKESFVLKIYHIAKWITLINSILRDTISSE